MNVQLKAKICALCLGLLTLVYALLPQRVWAADITGDTTPQQQWAQLDYDTYPIAPSDALQGRVIVLDPGHGEGNTKSFADFDEGESNLRLALMLRENLQRCGATVLMTRSTPPDVNNYVRMAKVNAEMMRYLRLYRLQQLYRTPGSSQADILREQVAECDILVRAMQSVVDNPSLSRTYFNEPYDYSHQRRIHPVTARVFQLEDTPLIYQNVLFLSIHSNANSSWDFVSGSVGYYLDNEFWDSRNYYTSYDNIMRRKRFAQMLCSFTSIGGDWPYRGVGTNDFFMLREHNLPSALAELGYFTTRRDRQKLNTPAWQQRLVNGMTYAVLHYFEVYPVTEDTIVPPESLLRSVAYTLRDGFLTAVQPDTDVATLLAACRAQAGYTLHVVAGDGTLRTAEEPVATGDALQVWDDNGVTVQAWGILVRGDVDGDGAANGDDLAAVYQAVHHEASLTLEGTYVADLDGDATVGAQDLQALKDSILQGEP